VEEGNAKRSLNGLGAGFILQKAGREVKRLRMPLTQIIEFINRPSKKLLVVEDIRASGKTIRRTCGNGSWWSTPWAQARRSPGSAWRKMFLIAWCGLAARKTGSSVQRSKRTTGTKPPPLRPSVLYLARKLSARETELRIFLNPSRQGARSP